MGERVSTQKKKNTNNNTEQENTRNTLSIESWVERRVIENDREEGVRVI